MDPQVLAPGRDLRVPAPLRRTLRHRRAHLLRPAGHRRPLGRGSGPLDRRHRARLDQCAGPRVGERALESGKEARPPGPRRLRGAGFPLCGVGPRGLPRRQAGGGRRHRCLRNPDRAGDRRRGGPPERLPAHPPVDHPEEGQKVRRPAAVAVHPRPGHREARTGPHLPATRVYLRPCPLRAQRQDPRHHPRAGDRAPHLGGHRPRPRRGAHAGLRPGLQAPPRL